jgi:hypothetical protein
MKAHVIFNDAGEIGAMHIVRETGDESDRRPHFSFAEAPGIHAATLDVPNEFIGHAPKELIFIR